jgi:hypothetical protein
MSEENGVIRIGRKGKFKFAFGDDEPFEVDVIEVHDSWYATDQQFRDEKGEIPVDKTLQYHETERAFVQNIVNASYGHGRQSTAPILTHAEAMEFIARVATEVRKLAPFFEVSSSDPQDFPQRTDIHFSQ